jgi:4-hydroxy-tetrahydrodipicolinate reductase
MTAKTYQIAIAGRTGKMGQAIARLAADDIRFSIDQNISKNAADLFANAALVIDFSRPEFTLALAQEAAKTGKALVSGTTGLSDAQMQALQHAAKSAPILWAANMSLGVNLLASLVQQAARVLGAQADIEILEMHHRHKIDAPSGTALMLGKAASEGLQVTLQDVAVLDRNAKAKSAREQGSIGFSSLRGGDVVGEHSVIFALNGERITLQHQATNRDIFARGALQAAHWLQQKPAGFYSMDDLLCEVSAKA